jgi:hypothetical protein
MHTVDLLEEALALAEQNGFSVRRQWLAEGIGGMCRIGEQRVVFINLANSSEEQLRHALEAVRSLNLSTQDLSVSNSLKRLLG